MVAGFTIGDRLVGEGHPVFVIAEAGVNHNGDLDAAKRLVDVACDARADAVKFQAFQADRLVRPGARKARYQQETTGGAESQLEMLRRLELSADAFEALASYCARRRIAFMATPFDDPSADLLHRLGVPAFKLASGEVTNWPFLEFVAKKGKPIVLSTGMSDVQEITGAVGVLRAAGCADLALLHCTSAYPADARDANLRAIATLQQAFGVPVGLSDHTLGIAVALAAVALGACIVEKHFTLSKALPGPDHQASLEPGELAELVRGIRTVEAAIGDGDKRPVAAERDTAAVARRSLVAARHIPAGTVLTRDLIAVKRPGDGLPPSMLSALMGRMARVDIGADELILLDSIFSEGSQKT